MLNKISSLLLVVLLIFIVFSLNCNATNDILMDLNQNTVSTDNETVDNTTYNTNTDEENVDNSNSDFEYSVPETSVDTDYDSSEEELSITNMINIIFIVVGIVLILLGIAIIIKLK